jgi:hypothetical protein
MKNPVWITVGEGDEVEFDGHQAWWADAFFSNATVREIDNYMETSRGMIGVPYIIREMTDAEVEQHPEAVEFREWLIKEYGEY